MSRPYLLVLPAALLIASLPAAQRAIRESTPSFFPGFEPADFGYAVARAGDVDGDGVEDYWMGGPGLTSASYGGGFLLLCSGADGTPSLFVDGDEPEQDLALALAGGHDLNGDGVPDVVAGSPAIPFAASDMGSVKAFSGADASLLWSVPGQAFGQRFGEALAFLDDLDGDGVPDVGVGAPGDDLGGTDRGSVRVYSGATGASLATRFGPSAGSEYGYSLSAVGDVDGDGMGDLVVGAPGASLVRLLSGANGSTLRTLLGSFAGDDFGHAVAGAGDLSGDGVPDVLVGIPGDERAAAFSGADGAELWSASRRRPEPQHFWYDGDHGSFGWAVCGLDDQDGDGVDDVAVGYPEYGGVWLLSGADGSDLGVCASAFVDPVPASSITSFLGWSLARVSDLNGDGRDELVAGAPTDGFGGYPYQNIIGAVDVLSFRDDAEQVLAVEGGSMGYSVSRAGDVDGDGLQDLAYATSRPNPPRALVVIASGVDHTVLREYETGWTLHPEALACAGDVDADGVEDLAVATGSGLAVYSGASGALLPGFASQPASNVAGIGDVNHDGHDDLAIGVGSAHPAGAPCGIPVAGQVRVLSGADAAVLITIDGELRQVFNCTNVGDCLGWSLTGVGDWNEDGTPDFAAGAPGAGEFLGGAVRVYSGVDGALLQEFPGGSSSEFGISVSGGPWFDFDADGHVDIVIGEQTVSYGPHPSTGSAVVFSGRDGSFLGGTGGSVPLGYGRVAGPGYAVAALADHDGDGYSDIAYGNPMAASVLGPGAGEVRILSGKRKTVTRVATGGSSWDYLGYTLTGLGDVDGNGTTDLFIGGPASEVPTSVGRAVVVRRKVPSALDVLAPPAPRPAAGSTD